MILVGCLGWSLAGCVPSTAQQVYDLNQTGVALLARDNYPGAQQQFQQAVHLDPANPVSRYNLGNAAHRSGDMALAERCYRDCLQMHPDHGPSRHGLALLCLQQNRSAEAWQLIEGWRNQRPELADAQAEYGWLLRESGDLPAAQAQLHKALEMDPANPRALTEMAIVYETCSYPDRARSLYQRALKRDPNQPEVIARLARLQHGKGE
jgi:Tfp pilus assembly protein PilF